MTRVQWILYTVTSVNGETCELDSVRYDTYQMRHVYIHDLFCTVLDIFSAKRVKSIMYGVTAVTSDLCPIDSLRYHTYLLGHVYNRFRKVWQVSNGIRV